MRDLSEILTEPIIGHDDAMLITREVICEQIYRNRGNLVDADGCFAHPNHINTTLKVRDVPLDLVLIAALTTMVTKQPSEMSKDELRRYAGQLLDRAWEILRERQALAEPPGK